MTIAELQQQLNRPLSMLQIFLKGLMAEKLIKKRKQETGADLLSGAEKYQISEKK